MRNIKHLLPILVLFFTACSSEEVKENEQFFVQEKDNKEIDLFTQISDSLEKNPNAIDLWIQKGKICKENMEFSCALDAGAKAFMLDSTNLEARKLYAWTLINKPDAPISDVERAKRHFQYVLSVEPKDPETLVSLANTFSLTGDFQTAIKYINDALKIDEFYRDGYVLKGSIYKILDNKDLALSSYQTALQIDPDFFIGHLNTGWLLTSMEKHQLALEYYRNAMELKPENINALYGVAKSLQDLGKYEEALEYYRKISEEDSKFFITYYNQGYIKQYFQNEPDSAAIFYERVVRLNPEYTQAWYQLGEVYFTLQRNQDAANAFGEALKLDENYTPAREAAEKLRNIKIN